MRCLAAAWLALAAVAAVVAPPQQADAIETWMTLQAKLQLEATQRPTYAFTETVVRTRREPAAQRFEDLDTIRVDVACDRFQPLTARMSSILAAHTEVLSHPIVQGGLICVPAPTARVRDRQVAGRIEAMLPERIVTRTVPAIGHLPVPQVSE